MIPPPPSWLHDPSSPLMRAQGREADVVIFSAVRAHAEFATGGGGDGRQRGPSIGFLKVQHASETHAAQSSLRPPFHPEGGSIPARSKCMQDTHAAQRFPPVQGICPAVGCTCPHQPPAYLLTPTGRAPSECRPDTRTAVPLDRLQCPYSATHPPTPPHRMYGA